MIILSGTRHSDQPPTVVGFFRRGSQQSILSNNSRRNSELEIQHQSGISEADIENQRQKKSLRQKQKGSSDSSTVGRQNSTLTDDVIPENVLPPPYESSEDTKF